MTRGQFAIGTAVSMLIVVAAFVTTRYVNARITDQATTEQPSASPCIDTGSRWKNWSWPNVPWLSPPCKQETPPKQQG
jgi:hypothetical protein